MPPPRKRKEKPFYGWRYIRHTLPDGRVELKEVALTLEDVLHPEEGDHIPEWIHHERDRRYLANVCQWRSSRLRNGLMLSDCIVNWGVAGLGNHSPDISVFGDLREPAPRNISTFHLGASGGRCVLVIEIVSPHTRVNDVVPKPPEYHRARVPLYVIVDQEEEDGPRNLLAYRWKRASYRPEPLDERKRVLAPLGLRLGLRDERVVCWDADMDEEIRVLAGEQPARQEAERRAQAETQARQEAERRARELEEQLRRLQAKPRKRKRPPGNA